MKEIKNANLLQYYLDQNYPIVLYRAEEGGYVAEIEELPGCITQGETLDEVASKIEDARQIWIETAYEDGVEIPLPRTEREYSGKFVLRVPAYLHQRLAEQATREGVSLNHYASTLLALNMANSSLQIQDYIREIRELMHQLVIAREQTISIRSLRTVMTNWGISERDMVIKKEHLPIRSKELIIA